MLRFITVICLSISLSCFAQKKKKKVKAYIDVSKYGKFIEKDFPFINSALDISVAPKNFPQRNNTPRGVLIKLGNKHWACFDRDLLRVMRNLYN